MIAAYLIGEPGAGKSTLMGQLVGTLDTTWERHPFAHAVYHRNGRLVGAQLGGQHDDYPGTDRLSMSVQQKAIDWIATEPAPVVVAEGDRLATAGFLDALDAAADFTLVWLDTPADLATERRQARGGSQDAAWVRGRRTKVGRLVADRPHVRLDGALPLGELLLAARAIPAFGALR